MSHCDGPGFIDAHLDTVLRELSRCDQENHCFSVSFARVTCSSLMWVAVAAKAAHKTPMSSVYPTIGVISGMTSIGEMKYPSAP